MAAGWGLTYVLLLALLLGQSSGEMICWQAVLKCQLDQQCSYAYRQYNEACNSVLNGNVNERSQRRCPSHCINAIIQLNSTKPGPALESCDCANDEVCNATKQAIEPCMPRTSEAAGSPTQRPVIGCTAARRRCERDSRCHESLSSYLRNCGALFNGLSCPSKCMAVILEMMKVPTAMLLSECVCDGLERAICESVKDSMVRLCFGLDEGYGGTSSGGESDDDFDDEFDYSLGPTKTADNGVLSAAPAFTLWTYVVLMALLGYV